MSAVILLWGEGRYTRPKDIMSPNVILKLLESTLNSFIRVVPRLQSIQGIVHELILNTRPCIVRVPHNRKKTFILTYVSQFLITKPLHDPQSRGAL